MAIIKKFDEFKTYETMDMFTMPVDPISSNINRELGLTDNQFEKLKDSIYQRVESMNLSEKNRIITELQNMANKFGCEISDLTDPNFVKGNLESKIKKENLDEVIEESFWQNIKDKLWKFFCRLFEISTFMASIIGIIYFAVAGSFWGVFLSAIAAAISVLVSAIFYNLKK
jgi:hypothetical protein